MVRASALVIFINNALRLVQVDEEHTNNESEMAIQYINRSRLKGTLLEDNIKELKERAKTVKETFGAFTN